MEYELKKTQLTFTETIRVVEDAVSACFEKDEKGNDIDFRPECKEFSLQCAFFENYIGQELSDDFDEAFATYMAVDIDKYLAKDVNADQWYAIRKAVNDKIEYRKQKLLSSISNAQSSTLTTLVSELVKKEIKNQDLQTKILEQTEKMNSQYTKEEILHMTETFAKVGEFANNPEYLKAVADAVHNDKTIKKVKTTTDHKKPRKTTGKSNVVVVDKAVDGE